MKIPGTKNIKPVHRDNPPDPVIEKDEPAPEKLDLIKGVTLTRLKMDGVSKPCALYDGDAPSKGAKIAFKLDNGVVYSGIVADATSADGNVLVEFKDGITPVS